MKVPIVIKQMQFLGVQKSQKLQIFYLDGALFLGLYHLEMRNMDRIIFKRFVRFWMPMEPSMT